MVAKKSAKKPVKKVTRKSTATKKAAPMKSFRVYKESSSSFTTFRITRQTVYWTILLVFIIITQLWILKVQLDISNLTNALLAS